MGVNSRHFAVDIEIMNPAPKQTAILMRWLETSCGLIHKDLNQQTSLHYTAIIKFASSHYSLDKQLEFWTSACAWKLWQLNGGFTELHITFCDMNSQLNQGIKLNLAETESASLGTDKTVWTGNPNKYAAIMSGESWAPVAAIIAKDMKDNRNLLFAVNGIDHEQEGT